MEGLGPECKPAQTRSSSSLPLLAYSPPLQSDLPCERGSISASRRRKETAQISGAPDGRLCRPAKTNPVEIDELLALRLPVEACPHRLLAVPAHGLRLLGMFQQPEDGIGDSRGIRGVDKQARAIRVDQLPPVRKV